MKTLLLNLKEGDSISSRTLPIHDFLTLETSFIDVVNYLDKGAQNTFVQFNHSQNSYLNVTNVSPYMLLFFDEDQEYIGTSLSIKSGSGSSIIVTHYKYVLFVKMPHDLKLNHIHSFQIEKAKKGVLK